ncbi:hypothetical protein R8Z50_12960 [Longispora sp. K20-0274]|uniref:hypothetical protein n=1 Tax=Longispora sp. K20-0274 TaxID=3088255 RepID=UPI00399A075D
MIITTAVGPARVVHRLALGVEVVDARTGRLVGAALRVGRQVPGGGAEPGWPCQDLEYAAPGRYRQRQVPGLPASVVIRIDDPTRFFAPRRFEVTLWPLADLERADATPPTGPYVPVGSRLLRPWLTPGSACALPRGSTAVRGRVVRDGSPVRWPRIVAFGAGGARVGWAHGDDRGEFLLVVTGPGRLPPPVDDPVELEMEITAFPTGQAPARDPADRLADLVVERVPRSTVPPTPADLDNPQLRGLARPPGHVASATGRHHLTVPVGTSLTVPDDLPFVG